MTVGLTGFMLAIGLAVLAMAAIKVHEAKTAWAAQEGADRVYSESAEWADRLEEAGDAVVHRVEAPRHADLVAGQMYHGNAEVGDQDRGEDLRDEWPTVWPQLGRGDDGGEQRDRGDAGQNEGFVDCDVDAVAHAIGAIVVPL